MLWVTWGRKQSAFWEGLAFFFCSLLQSYQLQKTDEVSIYRIFVPVLRIFGLKLSEIIFGFIKKQITGRWVALRYITSYS